MAEAYSNFAAVYDALMDNIPYDAWADYLHGLLVEYDIASGILAELGCGTGNITERMADFGYDMIGIDNSPAMLQTVKSLSLTCRKSLIRKIQAQQKQPSTNNTSIILITHLKVIAIIPSVSTKTARR